VHHQLVQATTVLQPHIGVHDLRNCIRHETGPGKNARATHPRRRDILGVAVRNTNPRRIRRYDSEVENALPFDDFAMAGTGKPPVMPAARDAFGSRSGMKFGQQHHSPRTLALLITGANAARVVTRRPDVLSEG
jgi:hypothetical protein